MKKEQSKGLALPIIAGVLAVLVVVMFFVIRGQQEEKKPQLYTWEEFEALSPEEQLVFPDRFENMQAFNDWLNRAQGNAAGTSATEIVETVPVPTVVLGDKAPEDFTWEDYQELPPDQQMVFPDAFDSMESFQDWLNRVQPSEPTEDLIPDPSSVDLGEKKPEDFTWEDYLALSMEEQMFFPDSFESYEAFEAWWAENCPEDGLNNGN